MDRGDVPLVKFEGMTTETAARLLDDGRLTYRPSNSHACFRSVLRENVVDRRRSSTRLHVSLPAALFLALISQPWR
ncbi:unnamed protein product [Heligmosomoides polygyrus]|uniref:Transposase n=1 Tax=Heligmosomoides polygyrus TaxID=6339 RepID=A0A183FE40_HELPZ|nr:unnamed protein product [Heligmosomoides polygyrus]